MSRYCRRINRTFTDGGVRRSDIGYFLTSRLGSSPANFTVKFCRILAKKRNILDLANTSPGQPLLPDPKPRKLQAVIAGMITLDFLAASDGHLKFNFTAISGGVMKIICMIFNLILFMPGVH